MPSPEAPILDPNVTMPYCRGCGHGNIARAIADAMAATGLDKQHLCLVSDIGCVGLIDKMFPTIHTVHTTHGRSTAMATGITIADGVLHDGKLKTVVVLGDGGATIGLLHLVSAAQLNADLTVVVHNNHLFGMTGGQASGLSPEGWRTATTRQGNPIPPLDIVGILSSAGASFIARGLATDRELKSTLQQAMDHPGFAVVEVLELCTPFGVRWNHVTGKKLQAIADATGAPLGVAIDRQDRPACREAIRPKPAQAQAAAPPARPTPTHRLDAPVRWVFAGTAGERVQSTAGMAGQIAVEAGLFATQKTDNLVTQGTGFSLSELILSPEPIHYTGIDSPDAAVATSADGLARLVSGGVLQALGPGAILLIDDTLTAPEVRCQVVRLPFRKAASPRGAALAALGWLLERSRALQLDDLVALSEVTYGAKARPSVKALRWGAEQART